MWISRWCLNNQQFTTQNYCTYNKPTFTVWNRSSMTENLSRICDSMNSWQHKHTKKKPFKLRPRAGTSLYIQIDKLFWSDLTFTEWCRRRFTTFCPHGRGLHRLPAEESAMTPRDDWWRLWWMDEVGFYKTKKADLISSVVYFHDGSPLMVGETRLEPVCNSWPSAGCCHSYSWRIRERGSMSGTWTYSKPFHREALDVLPCVDTLTMQIPTFLT